MHRFSFSCWETKTELEEESTDVTKDTLKIAIVYEAKSTKQKIIHDVDYGDTIRDILDRAVEQKFFSGLRKTSYLISSNYADTATVDKSVTEVKCVAGV